VRARLCKSHLLGEQAEEHRAMFSRQSESRFPVKEVVREVKDKEKVTSDLPQPQDELVASTERIDRCLDSEVHADDISDSSSVAGNSTASGGVSTTLSVGSTVRHRAEKENFAPVPRSRKSFQGSPRAPLETNSMERERELEVKDRIRNRKLCDELEEVREEQRVHKREIKDLSQQVSSKDKKIEELKKQVDHLTRERGEAFRRTAEAEEARNEKRKQLHDKEQELAAMKKKEEQRRQAVETTRKQFELQKKELESRAMRAEKENVTLKVQLEARKAGSEQQKVGSEQEDLRAERLACQILTGKLEQAEARAKCMEEECQHLREVQREGADRAQSQASHVEDQRQHSDAQIKALKEKLERADDRIKALEVDLETEKSEVVQLERRLATEKTTAGETEKEFERVRRQLSCPDVDARVRDAEDRAERAEIEVQKLTDWAEQQQLRELTAETNRLEELKRVRQDVLSQEEAARSGLIEDCKQLHRKLQEQESSFEAKLQGRLAEVEEKAKEERTDAAKLTGALEKEEEEANTCVCLWTRCQELEDKLKRANQEMQDLGRQAEEATRALEVQQTQNEGLRSMHEDELADVQEKVHAQLDALRADHEAALGARIADFDAQRDAERAATDQNVKALEDRCIAAKAKARDAQWRFLAEAVLVQESWECRDELWVQVKIVVSQWRRQVRWQEGDQKRLEAQEEELERLTAEIEREHEQHKKVQHDLHILQEVFQSREPELRRLQGMEAEYERQIWQLSDRMDGGHANPKQKIKLFQQIKDENNQLKEELKKKEKDIKKMEMELRKAHFYEAETSVLSEASAASGRTRATTPGAQRHQTAVTTPERKTPAATGSRTPGRTSHREHEREVLAGLADDRPGALQREKAEAQRQARANRRAADNAVQQYQHLKDIVETVLVTRGSRPEREGTCVSDCGTDQALFQRLRELMPPKKPEAPGSVTEGCSSGALADPKTPPKKQSAKVPSGSPSPPSDSPSPDEGLRLIEDLNV